MKSPSETQSRLNFRQTLTGESLENQPVSSSFALEKKASEAEGKGRAALVNRRRCLLETSIRCWETARNVFEEQTLLSSPGSGEGLPLPVQTLFFSSRSWNNTYGAKWGRRGLTHTIATLQKGLKRFSVLQLSSSLASLRLCDEIWWCHANTM